MIAQTALDIYTAAATDYLAGNKIAAGLFSEIPLPSVPKSVALIPISGVMTKADICEKPGTLSIGNQIMQAANNADIKSMVLLWEGVPGGQVDGTETLANIINTAKAIKPVLSATRGMTCSAGAWCAAQSTEWHATSATDQLACIGVMASMAKEADGKYKVIVSDLSPDKNAESANPDILQQNYLRPVTVLFQNAVKKGRSGKLKEDTPGLLTGATILSGAAKAAGLIDGIMPIEKVIQRAVYLGNKQAKTNNKMSAENNEGTFVFQNVLAAAGAEAAVPVSEGFALTEPQMTALDAAIANSATQLAAAQQQLEAANEQLATANAQFQDSNNQLSAANTALAAAQTELAALKPKPAHSADPAAVADPAPENKYHTSYDDELKAYKEKFNIK
jgi:ClpP class serine protease